MRILIDIGHPGHVHLFKNFAWQMQKKGHKVFFTCRQKEFEIELLKTYKFNYKSFGKHYKTTRGKIWGLIRFNFQMLQTALRFKPDIFLSHGSIYAAQIAWLLRKPHISFEDTGNSEQVRLYKPFTKYILTSTAFHKDYGKKQIKYSAYHELAYLHPNTFKPDNNIKEYLKINKKVEYALIRFVSWNASHDTGQKGISFSKKNELVNEISKFCKVFISSEQELPDDLKKYKINISPDKMHDVLAKATFFIGEGATMASECAMLGTPAVYVNSINAGTIKEQEKYGLIYHFENETGIIDKAVELLSDNNTKEKHQKKCKSMLSDKIDLTAFIVWFIENYPKSAKIIKENPDYQYKFK